MRTPEGMLATVHHYIRALNDSDLEGVVALYADDAEVEDPVGTPPHRGRDAIRAFYAGSLSLQLQVRLEGDVRIVAHQAAFAFQVRFKWNGQDTTISPIDVFDFNEEGLITRMRAFFGPANIQTH